MNKELNQKAKVSFAKLVLGYHEEAHSLQYDDARKVFSIIGLGSQVDHKMAEDALVAIGAINCLVGSGKVAVTSQSGSFEIATKIKEMGISFRGSENLQMPTKSR